MEKGGINLFYLSRLILGFLLGALLVVPNNTRAATLNDLNNELQRIKQENSKLQGEASETKEEIDSLEGAINFLDRSIATLERQISDTDRQIAETTTAIIEKEKDLATRKAQQDETIRVIYELQATDSLVESLLSVEDLSEATNRVEYVDALEQRLEQIMDQITAIKTELLGQRTSLENLRKQQVDQQNRLASQQRQKERLLANTEVELVQINRKISANRTKIAEIEAQITAQVAALWRRGVLPGAGQPIKKGTPIGRLGSTGYSTGPHVHFECLIGGSPVNPRGCVPPLSWPLFEFTVSQEYGRPNWNAAYSFHTGIDLVAPLGAPVLASCSGEVIMRQWYGGYGNAVVIACDNGWWTLYGHMIN